ncbi:MAG: hypothetical protein IJZ79_02475 [Bacilli bacterium]|nr:hypothetical protein [Bacilli bacterium]MBQ8218591.1 hypothetical protein [Bacilli bacterium]
MTSSVKEFFVIRCNKVSNYYLSFMNRSNLNNPKISILECGQGNSNDLSTAIFFDTQEEAEKVRELYIKADRVLKRYEDCVEVLPVTITDNNIYIKHNFKLNDNGLRFRGYIELNAFVSYIKS